MQTALFRCTNCYEQERSECTDEIFQTGIYICTKCKKGVSKLMSLRKKQELARQFNLYRTS